MNCSNKLTTFFIGLLLCVPLSYAQQSITIDRYSYYGPVQINKPLMVDKTDVNNNRFDAKNLLQSKMDLNQLQSAQRILQADSGGFITLPQDSSGYTLHLLGFHMDPDRYAKVQLEIYGKGAFNVFVDGKKEGANTHIAKDSADMDPVYINLTLEPRQYQVILQYLTEGGKADSIYLKTQLNKKDTLTQYILQPEGKRRLTLHDITDGNRLIDASLSPSGKYYYVTYRNVYPTEKSYTCHELHETKGNRLVYRFPSAEKPVWLPSSDRVYFQRQGKDGNNLILVDPQHLEEQLLAENPETESIRFSPDETFFIFSRKDKAPAESGSLKRYTEPDDRISGFRDRLSLYKYTLADKTTERITFGKTDTYLADISTDSKKMLIYTQKRDLRESPFTVSSFYIVDCTTFQTDTLFSDDRFIQTGSFSPDGKKILFEGTPEAFKQIGKTLPADETANGYDIQAFIMDINTKEVIPITKRFNPSVSGSHWSSLDHKIYLRCIDGDKEQVYRYDPSSDVFEQLPLKEDIIEKFSLPQKGETALYMGQSVSNPMRLYTFDLKTKKSVRMADPLSETLSGITLGEVKDFDFITADSSLIKGRYYLPPGFDPDKKYPLIVYYYGGTTPTARSFDSRYPLHVYAALGYVVYTLQPSGTIGFGQAFSARHVNAWGKQTADEIIEGTLKFCDTHSFVDSSKIGCIGASYGGFMTQYLQTKTSIFAAAVSHAGISNVASYWGEGYWGYSYGSIASAGSYPWNNPEMYVQQSPLFHADKINTPLLLLHGSADTNVPVGESIQMFNALKILGKTVEFVQVNGENHGIVTYKKRFEWNNTIFAWFAKWLKNEPEWWNELYP